MTREYAAYIKSHMLVPGTILAGIGDDLSPHLRVAVAVAPFLVAIVLRLLLGGVAFTRWLITLSTVWFAANVLMAPYSAGLRLIIRSLLP